VLFFRKKKENKIAALKKFKNKISVLIEVLSGMSYFKNKISS